VGWTIGLAVRIRSYSRFPLRLACSERGVRDGREILLGRVDVRIQLLPLRLLGLRRQLHAGAPVTLAEAAVVKTLLLQIGKEGGEAIEVLLQDRIELVVMALRTAHRLGHPDDRGVSHPLRRIFRPVFLVLHAALGAHHAQPVVAGGDLLFLARVGKQVARQLLPREHVEPLVAVERLDDPVPVGPDTDVLIAVIAHRIGIADQVEPVLRHALAVMRGGQQAIHQALVRIRPAIRKKCVDLLRLGWETEEIQAQPADQRIPIGALRGPNPFLLEAGQDEAVDRIEGPPRIL
jgi:hypothetical protein